MKVLGSGLRGFKKAERFLDVLIMSMAYLHMVFGLLDEHV
jgi:hypothetical protein